MCFIFDFKSFYVHYRFSLCPAIKQILLYNWNYLVVQELTLSTITKIIKYKNLSESM